MGTGLALIGIGFVLSNVLTLDDPRHDALLLLRAALMVLAAVLFLSSSDFVPVVAAKPTRLHYGLFTLASTASLVVLFRVGGELATISNAVGITLVEFAVWAAGLRFLQRRCDEPAIGVSLRIMGLGCFVAMAFGAGADIAYPTTFDWIRTGAGLLFVGAAVYYRAPVAAVLALALGVEGWASRLYLGDAHTWLIGIARGLGLGLFVLGLWHWHAQSERARLERQISNPM
jgi:hypothetical protein